jgi:hypothetical protein
MAGADRFAPGAKRHRRRHHGGHVVRKETTIASRSGQDAHDDQDWWIPEDGSEPDGHDPWSAVIDEGIGDDEYRFPYPAGLP